MSLILTQTLTRVASIAEKPETKALFEEQMRKASEAVVYILESSLFSGKEWWPTVGPAEVLQQFAFPDCDVSADPKAFEKSETSNAVVFGRFPNLDPYDIAQLQFSMLFPRGMATEALFPLESSFYTDPKTGVLYESQCFVPDAEAAVEHIVCPFPFLSPTTEALIGKVNCIKPCPVQAYSDGEYRDMWTVSSVPASLGLLLNIFMGTTMFIGGKKAFRAVPFNLKMCVADGLLYGIIDTLPVLFLGEDLPW